MVKAEPEQEAQDDGDMLMSENEDEVEAEAPETGDGATSALGTPRTKRVGQALCKVELGTVPGSHSGKKRKKKICAVCRVTDTGVTQAHGYAFALIWKTC